MSILTSKTGGVFTLRFDRPEKRNAICLSMYAQMTEALRTAEADPEVKAILFVGSSDAFTSGNDIEEFLTIPPEQLAGPILEFMRCLSQASKPVVAAVRGVAIGIGTTLLLHCDLVYAADDAKFVLPFTQLGLCPEFASTLLLPQLVGYQRAAEKLLLGEAFSAQEAHELGLVNKIMPSSQVEQYGWQQVEKLANLPSDAVRITKRLMKGMHSAGAQQRMIEEIGYFSEMLKSPQTQQIIKNLCASKKRN